MRERNSICGKVTKGTVGREEASMSSMEKDTEVQ